MCTSITINSKDGNTIVGRTMEYAKFLNSEVFFRPKGYQYVQDKLLLIEKFLQLGLPIDDLESIDVKKLHTWEGLYSFIGMNSFKIDFAANGMNSEGLVTGDMVLTVAEYQDGKEASDNSVLWYPYLTNWILSTCSSVEDVKNKLPEIVVTNPINEFTKDNPGFLMHFPVNDAQGNAIVIEFTDGKLQIHDNSDIGVLTNDPVFPWQKLNLNNYSNITPFNQPAREGARFSVSCPSQGTGFSGLPANSTPVSRFVRAAMMVNYAYEPETTEESVNLAVHVLNTIDIPFGTIREGIDANPLSEDSDLTQWLTISDTQNLKYYIRMYGSPSFFVVDFKEVLESYVDNLSSLANIKIAIPTKENFAIDLTKSVSVPEPAL
ncbi:linear amide C-N hydrolase [Neptunitalea lumnitzerae]|uniref:Choloylglycine hydrolase n=1 Tax=Neptunitalea lumnitzerae TaxID=2965509 RepID=A0ABQ5MK68_9FLAO|nr:linear amide C-N hydrolase [Neptunitalea sp. Y10]GLB49773.1 choloylglycine hydrolase [Neptunitalea sp. Y10]